MVTSGHPAAKSSTSSAESAKDLCRPVFSWRISLGNLLIILSILSAASASYFRLEARVDQEADLRHRLEVQVAANRVEQRSNVEELKMMLADINKDLIAVRIAVGAKKAPELFFP